MSKILDIYKEYKIMPNLQLHQLRVAGVAEAICESLPFIVDKKSVITACLLHDMGNIIKFKLDHFPDFNNPEGIEYWESVKNEYIEKYGNNEHHATVKIARELNVSDFVIELIDSIDSSKIELNKKGDSFEKKICVYSDNRVDPFKIVSIKERNEEARERYKNHPKAFNENSHVIFNSNIKEIENQIFSSSNLKPEDINDESVKDYMDKLKNFEI